MNETKYWRASFSLKPFKFMEAKVSSTHKRSNSDPAEGKPGNDKSNNILKAFKFPKLKEMGKPENSEEVYKGQADTSQVQSSLKQEVLQLQERLKDQFVVRRAFEMALSCKTFPHDTITDKSIPEDVKELIKQIAVLELEVGCLEQYLLSLYRKVCSQSITTEETSNLTTTKKEILSRVSRNNNTSEKEKLVITQCRNSMSSVNPPSNLLNELNDTWGPQNFLDSSIHRSHSSLSHRSTYVTKDSPASKYIAKAVDSYHSLPLSMFEQAEDGTSSGISLADHLGTSIPDHVQESSNWLSEEMIKCISDIYCELADPPLINHDFSFSPLSYASSLDIVSSSQGQTDNWSPQCEKLSSSNSIFDNHFSISESEQFSGPYCSMVKIEKISREKQKLKDIEHKLQYYRSLVYRLEEVDPRRMNHDQKLAFWINVHNALVMHAFLVYGVAENNLKRVSLLLKAAYTVGGQTINVETIQSSILGCRMPRPGQVNNWFRFLFQSKPKLKVGDRRKSYTIDHPEPRLYFALCSGCCSDPVVRIYTPNRVFQDLEVAKEEYIQSNFSISKEQKILLPKIVEYFAKDSEMCQAGLIEMIENFMPDSLRKNIQQCHRKKFRKNVEWTAHNFVFRFLLSKELA